MKQSMQSINLSQLSKVLFLLVVLLSVTGIAIYARGPSSPGDPDTPIDGGISLLVAMGVGIGVKKVREMRKRKNNAPATKE
jgi:hypothetical protein